MRTRFPISAFSLFFCAAVACAPTPEEALTDDTESQSSELTAYSNSTFYIANGRDLRRCAYPLCGGVYMKRVNQAKTVCSDGSADSQCRVLEFDFKALSIDSASESKLKQLVDQGQALVRGSIVKTAPIAGKTYDKFVVQEAWEARALAAPSGNFVRVRKVPVACPACASYQSEQLNGSVAAQRFHRLVFDPARFSATLARELESTLASADSGLLLAGKREASGSTYRFQVSEAYTPFKGGRVGKVDEACGSRGLPLSCESGAFCKRTRDANCGRADAPGVCTTLPTICITIYKPVCGCNGMTYSNECQAYAAGTSVDYDGPCS